MDHKVVWSPEAVDDVEAIADYIARDSEFYARAVVSRILDAAEAWATYPLAGRVVPEVSDETIREQFVYSYRLIYRVVGEIVTVAAVIHGRRLLEAELDRLKNT